MPDVVRQTLVFVLNGERVVIDNPDPTALLSDYLHEVGITGTKVACGQGGCGACTVLVSDQANGKPVHRGVNACVKTLCSLDGMTVTTTEGIGHVHQGLDRLRQFCCDLEQFNPHDCISEWRIDWAERWQEVVAKAWLNRVSLSAAELYKTPSLCRSQPAPPARSSFSLLRLGCGLQRGRD